MHFCSFCFGVGGGPVGVDRTRHACLVPCPTTSYEVRMKFVASGMWAPGLPLEPLAYTPAIEEGRLCWFLVSLNAVLVGFVTSWGLNGHSTGQGSLTALLLLFILCRVWQASGQELVWV